MTSEWCSTWHLVGRDARGAVIVATCGHPLTGRMSRVLVGPMPEDTREVCAACVAAVGDGDEPATVRYAVLEDALDVMAQHRSFRAEPPPDSDLVIRWPERDPDVPGVLAFPKRSSAVQDWRRSAWSAAA